MMDKKILFLSTAVAVVLMLLIAGLTAYIIKFNRMKQDWATEKTKRENLEVQVSNREKELLTTKQELSAKTNEANILQEVLDSTKSEASVLKNKFAEIEQEKRRKEAEFAELQASLQSEIEAQEITITQLKGKLTVNLVDKILFDSGKADLKFDGKKVLDKIAELLLNKYPDRQIRVEGHTDDLAIGAALQKKFPTNWELSAQRAIAAVRYLHEKSRVDSERLAAVAFGQYHPIDDRKTPEARARNRRIEIVLLPSEPEIRTEAFRGKATPPNIEMK